MARVLHLTAPAALLVLVACGGAPSSPPRPPAAESGEKTAAPAAPRSVTSLRRAQVKETILHGLGAFLQNVTVEDWPVMHEGKFHGFKIQTINSAWGVDLRPGDVVTRVNGVVPERPEDAETVLRSLEKATSLKVDFERDGKAKTLELPIVD